MPIATKSIALLALAAGAGPVPDQQQARPNGAAAASGPLQIVSSTPPNDYSDPRVESSDGVSLDRGLDSITLTFSGAASAVMLGDLQVSSTTGSTPLIDSITPSGNDLVVDLDRIVPVGGWTTITHTPSGTETRIGFLPGDVDGSGRVTGIDMVRFLDAFQGCAELPFGGTPQNDFLDIDRNGATSPVDLIRLRQLFNGISPATQAWYDESIVE